jgi:hypothetical protein
MKVRKGLWYVCMTCFSPWKILLFFRMNYFQDLKQKLSDVKDSFIPSQPIQETPIIEMSNPTYVPPSYSDVVKPLNDLLSKDYPVGSGKLELNTSAPNGVVIRNN